ncbi:hypothetical protein [Maribacter polysaccharolyticus]|nr:hypothetical protein [Maribacter polysaccharolyticus]MDE3743290.1 hypothetical protein [Maribacter polysaccharolyticus]
MKSTFRMSVPKGKGTFGEVFVLRRYLLNLSGNIGKENPSALIPK